MRGETSGLTRLPLSPHPAPAVPTTGATGFLTLRFSVWNGRTALVTAQARNPLQAGRLLSQPDGGANLFLLNPAGGLLGGDDLSIEVALEPGARVRLRTTGATKVYLSLIHI